jgi:acetyl esterase/lipase
VIPQWARDRPFRLLDEQMVDGVRQLVAVDLADGVRRQVTRDPLGTDGGLLDPLGEHIWWFQDGWYRRPFAGGNVVQPSRARPGASSAGAALGADFALLASVDRNGTTIDRVDDTGVWPIGRDPDLVRVAGISADDHYIATERPGMDSRHAVVVLTGTGELVAELRGEFSHRNAVAGWSPVRGDARLIIHHEDELGVRPTLWHPDTGELCWPVPSEAGETWAEWLPDGTGLLLNHETAGRCTLSVLDLSTRSYRRLDTPPGHIAAAKVRPDGQLWLVTSSGAHEPRFHRIDLDRRITPHHPAPGRPYRLFRVDDVGCFLIEPCGPPPYATVFSLHGGPATHDSDSFTPRVQAWASLGFAVVLVNYRGSTGRGRTWRTATQSGPGPGFVELADVAAVREHLVTAGVTDPGRLVLSGGSWGGYLTLLGLALQPDLWSLGVAVAPIADWEAAYQDEAEDLRAHDRALFGGSFEERRHHYAERSPITHVDRLRAPVLVVYGGSDDNTPPRQIENFLSRLRALGKPHAAHKHRGGHRVLSVDEQIRQHEVAVEFVRSHLGARAGGERPPAKGGQA